MGKVKRQPVITEEEAEQAARMAYRGSSEGNCRTWEKTYDCIRQEFIREAKVILRAERAGRIKPKRRVPVKK